MYINSRQTETLTVNNANSNNNNDDNPNEIPNNTRDNIHNDNVPNNGTFHLNIEDFLDNELQDEISLNNTITIDSENNSETKNNSSRSKFSITKSLLIEPIKRQVCHKPIYLCSF